MDERTPNEKLNRSQDPTQSIPETVTRMVDQTVQGLEPKIHDAVNDFTERAVRYSNQAIRDLTAKARHKPLYMIGAIALVAIGVGFILGLEERRDQRSSTRLH